MAIAMLIVLGSNDRLGVLAKGRNDTIVVNEREEEMEGGEKQPIKSSLLLEPVERQGKAFLPRM